MLLPNKIEPSELKHIFKNSLLNVAKQAQVQKHVIDKAIDKTKAAEMKHSYRGRYEALVPNGSMIIAETLAFKC